MAQTQDHFNFPLKKKEKEKEKKKILKSFRLCLVTVFVFYFQKLVLGNIKKKKQFSCIFEIKNIFGQLKIKRQFFEEKNRKY